MDGTEGHPDQAAQLALSTGGDMPDTMIGTASEQAEAKVRRLMAERAAIPLTWETRPRRDELYRQVLAALEEHAEARSSCG